jgi:hypothetical protein
MQIKHRREIEMDRPIERKVDSFIAKTDTGKFITIIVMQEFTDITPFGQDVREESPGSLRYTTSDGRAVKKIDGKTFEVSGNNEKYIVTQI